MFTMQHIFKDINMKNKIKKEYKFMTKEEVFKQIRISNQILWIS